MQRTQKQQTDRQTDRGTLFANSQSFRPLTCRDRILKMKRHSNFHARPSIVFWLVLMLKLLHEIIVTIEVLQDTVQVSIVLSVSLFKQSWFFTALATFWR